MKYLLIIALWLGTAQASSNVMSPNENLPGSEGRIIDGWPAAINQFPWHVALRIVWPGGDPYICGGSLISDKAVLTTAHCVYQITGINVRLGSIALHQSIIAINTFNRTIHPEYNPNTLANNIAVVRSLFPVGHIAAIQSIRLPTLSQVDTTFAGEVVAVSGFGLVSDTSTSLSNFLQWVNVTVISNDDCAESFGSDIVTPEVLCARGTQFATQSTCTGDGGGALVYYEGPSRIPVQVGIVSFVSDRGCSAGFPSGYVRISKYLHWIAKEAGIELLS